MTLFDLSEYDRRTIQADRHLAEIEGIADKVVVSVSSGKTSTYMALNKNPNDKRPYFYQFAVVLTSDPNAKPKDKGLFRECQKRIPWFEASHEVDDSLKVVLQLEQELQQPIRWVASELTFEQLIEKKGRLPSSEARICTQYLKYEPMFWDAYLNLSKAIPENDFSFVPNPLSIEVQIGFRYDEPRRVYRALGLEKDSNSCDSFEFSFCCDLIGQFAGCHRWKNTEWRIRSFPLYSKRITSSDVYCYWEKRNWDYAFPSISNCVYCFYKTNEELKEQTKIYPERLPNWMDLEAKTKHTFKKNASLGQRIFKDVFSVDQENAPCNCTD
jgi:hypothetical protein